MAAYYNENDPYAAEWLEALVAAGHLPAGRVDKRSIRDVDAADLDGFSQCHFFAGIGGWPLALRMAGWPDDKPVWTGSCPCQPFSSAGQRQGTADERHLWPDFAWLVLQRRPPVVFGEQVASRLGREWLAGVRLDLEVLGYAVGAADLPAAGVGAPHIRQRLFWVADATGQCGSDESIRNGSAGQHVGAVARTGRGTRWRHPAERSGETPTRNAGTAGAGGVAQGNGGLPGADGGQPRHRGLQPGGQHRQQPQDRGVGQRLANAAGHGCGARPGAERRTESRPALAHNGSATGGLADAEHAIIGRAQQHGHVLDRHDAGRPQEHRQPGACSEVFWDAAVWLPCLDGKARRTQPGIFPLAYGVSARVGRLRAYGNAIVPQAAAVFVKAFAGARADA